MPIKKQSGYEMAFRAQWLVGHGASVLDMAGSSASCYDRTEDVGIIPVIEAEGEFVEVERQVLLADLVERPHDAALQERPEGVEVRRVDVAAHVLALAVINGLMAAALPINVVVGERGVGGDERHLVRNGLVHEGVQRRGRRVLDQLRHDIPLARYGSHYRGLAVVVLAA